MPLSRFMQTAAALTLLSTSAQAASFSTQYAELKAVKISAGTATLTLDYVEVFTSDADAARAVKLGDYPSVQAFWEANPGGIYVRNANPKLRTLKTDARTTYRLVCLAENSGLKVVSMNMFFAAWKGQKVIMKASNGETCAWDFPGTVRLTLNGQRIVSIDQVYYP